MDSVIGKLQEQPIAQADIDRALVKLRSSLYDNIDEFYGFGKLDLMASFALFDNNPSRINELEANFKAVTPEVAELLLGHDGVCKLKDRLSKVASPALISAANKIEPGYLYFLSYMSNDDDVLFVRNLS